MCYGMVASRKWAIKDGKMISECTPDGRSNMERPRRSWNADVQVKIEELEDRYMIFMTG